MARRAAPFAAIETCFQPEFPIRELAACIGRIVRATDKAFS
jgi:hypothetical protein